MSQHDLEIGPSWLKITPSPYEVADRSIRASAHPGFLDHQHIHLLRCRQRHDRRGKCGRCSIRRRRGLCRTSKLRSPQSFQHVRIWPLRSRHPEAIRLFTSASVSTNGIPSASWSLCSLIISRHEIYEPSYAIALSLHEFYCRAISIM